jgi:hypothetical protein
MVSSQSSTSIGSTECEIVGAWSSETCQPCHGDEVAVPVGDLGLDAYWPSFVVCFGAFELASLGLAPCRRGWLVVLVVGVGVLIHCVDHLTD